MKVSSIFKCVVRAFTGNTDKKTKTKTPKTQTPQSQTAQAQTAQAQSTDKKTINSAFKSLASFGKALWNKCVPTPLKNKAKKYVGKKTEKYVEKKMEEVAKDVNKAAQKGIEEMSDSSKKAAAAALEIGSQLQNLFPELKCVSDFCSKMTEETSLKDVMDNSESHASKMSGAKKIGTVLAGLGVLIKSFSKDLKPIAKIFHSLAETLIPDTKEEDGVDGEKKKVDSATKVGLLAAAAGVISSLNPDLKTFTNIFDWLAAISAKKAAKASCTHPKSSFLYEVMREEEKEPEEEVEKETEHSR